MINNTHLNIKQQKWPLFPIVIEVTRNLQLQSNVKKLHFVLNFWYQGYRSRFVVSLLLHYFTFLKQSFLTNLQFKIKFWWWKMDENSPWVVLVEEYWPSCPLPLEEVYAGQFGRCFIKVQSWPPLSERTLQNRKRGKSRRHQNTLMY